MATLQTAQTTQLQQGQVLIEAQDKALIALRGQHKELNAQVADKQKLLEQERRIQSLEIHRQQLQAGDACPLCGSAEHPAIAAYQALDVSATEAALKENRLRWKRWSPTARKLPPNWPPAVPSKPNGKRNRKRRHGKLPVARPNGPN